MKIGKDKYIHAGISGLMVVGLWYLLFIVLNVGNPLFRYMSQSNGLLLISTFITFILGYIHEHYKEIVFLRPFSWKDIFANIVGMIIAVIIILIIGAIQ